MNIGYLLKKRAFLTPDKCAVVDGEKRYTFAEFNLRVNRLANGLLSIGVRPGDRVAVLMFNSSEFIECYFALAKIDAIIVPINYRLVVREIKYILEDSGSSVLIFGKEFIKTAEPIKNELSSIREFICTPKNCIAWAKNYDDIISSNTDEEPHILPIDISSPQIIMYTSGTTGQPKGVVLTHKNSIWNSINGIVDFGIRESDITLVAAPLFHIGALHILTIPHLHIGGGIVIMNAFDAKESLQFIQKEKITNMFGVPTMFGMMLNVPDVDKYNLSSLRFLVTGGAPCPVPIIKAYFDKLGVMFLQGYGLTESSPSALLLRSEDALRKAGSVGKPFLHVDVRIVDENHNDISPGEVGEIVIKGKTVMKGYWQNDTATEETIRDGWLHTGDLAKIDEEDYIYIVDRKKDMIISGGENIYPAEVEQVLYTHPQIAEAAVIGVPDAKWGETVKAVISKKSKEILSPEEVIEFCRKNLAAYKCPKSVDFVDTLPKTSSGKILKRELREKFHN